MAYLEDLVTNCGPATDYPGWLGGRYGLLEMAAKALDDVPGWTMPKGMGKIVHSWLEIELAKELNVVENMDAHKSGLAKKDPFELELQEKIDKLRAFSKVLVVAAKEKWSDYPTG
ncbi:hypothetical protein ACGFX8_35980 [Streptomyces sp. NPDC048362]|uniref:hypothetical protein n=1 Tax=Streptomyces sp. NPDC048362 TaxID=3365539 RepID=UPI00371B9160